MKALVYTAPRKAEYKDWPDPVLEPGEALVRVHAASVCGSDLHGWLGHSRGRVPPLILGHEVAGEVVEVRDGDAMWQPGARIAIYPLVGCDQCAYCTSGRDYLCRRRRLLGMHMAGAFAEYVKAPTKCLYPISAQLGFTPGALVEPLACGVHMAEQAKADCGPFAVLGAGPIGLNAMVAARHLGFPKTAVVEPNAHRAAAARRLGADLTVNPQDPRFQEELDQFFGEDGCAVVFDAAGFSSTRRLAVKLVRTGGLIVTAGLGEAETSVDFVEMIRREIRMQGVFAYSRHDFQAALEWLEGKQIDLSGWISEAPLADGQSIFEDLVSPASTRVKVVLRP